MATANVEVGSRDENADDVPLKVVVVESHQHVLEHIHAALRDRMCSLTRRERRERRKPFSERATSAVSSPRWTMVHFDSHPDLACPGPHVPAAACFVPRREWPSREEAAAVVGQNPPCRHHFDDSRESGEKGDEGGVDPEEEGDHDETTTAGKEGRNLYELLDSSRSGIAEWILPLALSAGLETVHWVRNSWCDQFADGMYRFNVGAWIPPHSESEELSEEGRDYAIESFLDLPNDAVVRVDLHHPYYLDDKTVVPSNELMLAQEVQWVVSELDACKDIALDDSDDRHRREDATTGLNRSEKDYCIGGDDGCCGDCDNAGEGRHDGWWVLDICLDYFTCLNPFLAELEELDKDFAAALVDVVRETKFRQSVQYLSIDPQAISTWRPTETETNSCCGVDSTNGSNGAVSSELRGYEYYEEESCAFHRIMKCYFEAFIKMDDNALESKHDEGKAEGETQVSSSTNDCCSVVLSSDGLEDLCDLYSSPSVGEELFGKLDKALKFSRRSPIELASLALDALPSISMPHSSVDHDSESSFGGEEALLRLVMERVNLVGDVLQAPPPQWGIPPGRPPMLVTIARSACDGFTPASVTEHLQEAVLLEIHRTYSGCDDRGIAEEDDASSIRRTACQSGKRCQIEVIQDYEP